MATQGVKKETRSCRVASGGHKAHQKKVKGSTVMISKVLNNFYHLQNIFFKRVFFSPPTFSSRFISAASSLGAPYVPGMLRFLEERSVLSHQNSLFRKSHSE